MARTTSDLVKGILLQDYDAKKAPSLTPFIDTASIVVDEVVRLAAGAGYPLAANVQEMVERWLSAHMYQQSDKGYQSKGQGGASASFAGQTTMGFESTLYGQTAMRLDFSGYLTAINKRQVAGCQWLGKTQSEQIPYDDRML